jgi:uncharacterized protein (TIGR02117 family)
VQNAAIVPLHGGFAVSFDSSVQNFHHTELQSMNFLQSRAYAIGAVFLLGLACTEPIAQLQFGRGNTKSVFIVNYGWHAAIVLKKADVSELLLPEAKDFPDSDYLEFGWGDLDFYQAPDPGLGLTLKAAFWSSGSVLHVAGLTGTLEKYYPSNDIVEIGLSQEGFQRAVEFISDTFSRPGAATHAGLYLTSRFYSAKGKFHVFRTCNTWVAEALRAAGLPLSGRIVTAGGLMHDVKRWGSPYKASSQTAEAAEKPWMQDSKHDTSPVQ